MHVDSHNNSVTIESPRRRTYSAESGSDYESDKYNRVSHEKETKKKSTKRQEKKGEEEEETSIYALLEGLNNEKPKSKEKSSKR